jgi:hypothetical protein
MNASQEKELRNMIASLKIEKNDLQEQKAELNAEHDLRIEAINERINVINIKLVELKEGLPD